MKKLLALPMFALLLAGTHTADARTKMVTLPDRTKLVTSLQHPERTLLYEERMIPLQKGGNFVDFSWNGVQIDQSSVLLELVELPTDAALTPRLISIGIPPNEAALTWQIYSPEARIQRIRVSYLIHGISQEPSYEFTVNKEETKGNFQQFLLMRNNSGENLDNTQLRLPGLEDLSRSVESGESRRFLAIQNPEYPITKLFVVNASEYASRADERQDVNLVYELYNDGKSGMGRALVPTGKIRLYAEDGQGSSIFIGEDTLPQAAPGEKAELVLGTANDVSFKRFKVSDKTTNEKFNKNRTPVLFDVEKQVRYELQNFKETPVQLRINESMYGDWLIREVQGGAAKHERKAIDRAEIIVDLPGTPKGSEAEKINVTVDILIRNVFPNERR